MIRDQLLTLQSSCLEQKAVEIMYPFVDVCDEVAPVLPEIIERLEVVKRAHDEGSRFNERVKEIKERQARIEEKLSGFKFGDVLAEWSAFKKTVESEFNKLEKLMPK